MFPLARKEDTERYKLYICIDCGTSGVDACPHHKFCNETRVISYGIRTKRRVLKTCPQCNFKGRGRLFETFHFDNCKTSPNLRVAKQIWKKNIKK